MAAGIRAAISAACRRRGTLRAPRVISPERPATPLYCDKPGGRLTPVARVRRLMAEVKPLNALHYNLAAVPSLGDVTAPPYDVIDAAGRAELLRRYPLNVVEIDLP